MPTLAALQEQPWRALRAVEAGLASLARVHATHARGALSVRVPTLRTRRLTFAALQEERGGAAQTRGLGGTVAGLARRVAGAASTTACLVLG